jgi:hypothetical protein
MNFKYGGVLLLCITLLGCGGSPVKESKVLVQINDYKVTLEEFNEGFSQSAFSSRDDAEAARGEYLDNMINQKVILLDAQKKNIDKQKDFLRSIERFWEQSLLTVAMGNKTREITGSVRVSEEQIRKLYDQMAKEGIATKPYQEMYAQIRWQAEKQIEAQLLNAWMNDLRKNAKIVIDKSLLKAEK